MPVKRRGALALATALLLAGTAGAYVPYAPTANSGAQLGEPRAASPVSALDSTVDFERLLARLDVEEKELDLELAPMAAKLATVQQRMNARGRQYFRHVRAGLLPVGGGFDAFVDHAAKVERTRAALLGDIAEERELHERQAALTKELRRVRAEKAPLVVQREAMRRARAAMQEADERRDAFARAFGSGPNADGVDGHFAVYGADTGPVAGDPLARFTSMRGRLSFPLAGRAEVASDADQRRGSVALRAGRDTVVRSVYGGTVAFAGETDATLTVVVDHGERYYTVYGNLQRIDVKVGDPLPERGRVGRIERRRGQPATLHFELRYGKSLLDPGPWLGL